MAFGKCDRRKVTVDLNLLLSMFNLLFSVGRKKEDFFAAKAVKTYYDFSRRGSY